MSTILDFTKVTDIQDADVIYLARPGDVGDADKYILGSDLKAQVKGTTKILWTGPLSVVSTPTSLDSGEDFDNWDAIIIDANLTSDSGTNFQTHQYIPLLSFGDNKTIVFYTAAGTIAIRRITSTSFEISSKSLPTGSVFKLIGISL